MLNYSSLMNDVNRVLLLPTSLWLAGIWITSSLIFPATPPRPSPHGQPGSPTCHVVDSKWGAESHIVQGERVNFALSLSSFSVRDLLVWSQDRVVGVAATLRSR